MPVLVQGQVINSNNSNKAPVVLDGQVLFNVADFGDFSAEERAETINQALIKTMKSPEVITIDLVQTGEQITIQNTNTQQHLLTVTQADLESGTNPLHQALLWKNNIQSVVTQGQKERSRTYQSKVLLITLMVTLIAIAIHFFLQFLRRLSFHYLAKIDSKNTKSSLWHQLIIQWSQLCLLSLQLGIWLYALIYTTNLFPQTRSWHYWLNSPLLNFDTKSYSALEILLLCGWTVAIWFVVRTITNLLKHYLLKKTITEPAIRDVIAISLQCIFTALGLIILWQSWGIDVGALALTASVLGVGIGFGLQNIANNFISGLILTLERPIKVGDLIKVNDLIGTVRNIGSRSTEILTQDHIAIIIPNSQLLDNQLLNWNHRDSHSRLRIPIGVSYNSDLRKVRAALLSAAKKHPDILRAPRPQIFFQKFNHSSLDFELLVWIRDPKKQFRITSDLNYLIMASLRRYEIEIPFPQTDVNFNSPRLEQLLISWFSYQGMNLDLLPEITTPENPKNPVDNYHKFINNKTALLLSTFEEKLTEIDLDQLVAEMRGEDGLNITGRRYHLSYYPSCFIGSEAIDWIVKQQGFTREEAIELGQILIERGIIHHVTDEHPFQDSYLFYRFCIDD
ncbi:MAG: mechanosensitive ion channel domain-containing protein [Cyanobacteria bacterium P01_G01_bin.67]